MSHEVGRFSSTVLISTLGERPWEPPINAVCMETWATGIETLIREMASLPRAQADRFEQTSKISEYVMFGFWGGEIHLGMYRRFCRCAECRASSHLLETSEDRKIVSQVQAE